MRNTCLNIRTTDQAKSLLQKASGMLGVTLSAFMLSAATEKAHQVVNHQKHFTITEKQWDRLCKIFEGKKPSNLKLQSLLNNEGIFE